MAFDKEGEILRFAQSFLTTLSERCMEECGREVPSLQFPVFKKFLSCRVRRELEFNRLCLDAASILTEAGCAISERDIEEVVAGSIDLDNRLLKDIKLLPVRIRFDYQKILPLRRERARRQIHMFMRFLSTGDVQNYGEMLRGAFEKGEYLALKNEILEFYVEEAYVVNSSITSLVKVKSGEIAERMYCSMLDLGLGLNRAITEEMYAR